MTVRQEMLLFVVYVISDKTVAWEVKKWKLFVRNGMSIWPFIPKGTKDPPCLASCQLLALYQSKGAGVFIVYTTVITMVTVWLKSRARAVSNQSSIKFSTNTTTTSTHTTSTNSNCSHTSNHCINCIVKAKNSWGDLTVVLLAISGIVM